MLIEVQRQSVMLVEPIVLWHLKILNTEVVSCLVTLFTLELLVDPVHFGETSEPSYRCH